MVILMKSFNRIKKIIITLPVAATIVILMIGVSLSAAAEKINFYFPTSVQGPLTREMQKMVKQYNEMNNDVKVIATFTGSYEETSIKASAAVKAGRPPAVALMSANFIHEFVADKQIEPIEFFLKESKQTTAAFLSDFWPGLHANATVNGKLYAVPFQNSTPILYINADHFREAGLDPDNPPKTWEELVAVGKKLIKKEGEKTTRYGLMLPMQYNYVNWVFQGFVMSNGGQYYNAHYLGEVYYDTSTTRGALQFYSDLIHKHGIMPASITNSKQVSTDFFAGRTSMMILSTGTLSHVRNNAQFKYNVGFVPSKVRNGVPIGGASMIIFKGITEKERAAAWDFVSWLTAPEQLGSWSRFSGYFAPRKSSYEMPVMKEFMIKNQDAAVALDQLQYAGPWYSTFKTVAVAKPMGDAIQAVVTGKKTVGEVIPEAQRKADELLKPYNAFHGYTQKQ